MLEATIYLNDTPEGDNTLGNIDDITSSFTTRLEDRFIQTSSAMQYLNDYKTQQAAEEKDVQEELIPALTGKLVREPEVNVFEQIDTLDAEVKPKVDTTIWQDIQGLTSDAGNQLSYMVQNTVPVAYFDETNPKHKEAQDFIRTIKKVVLGVADMPNTTIQKTIDFGTDIFNYKAKSLMQEYFYPDRDISELPDLISRDELQFDILKTRFPTKGSPEYEASPPQYQAYYDAINASTAFHLSREMSSWFTGYGAFKMFVKNQMKKQTVKPNTAIAAFAASSKNLFMTEVLPSAFASANIDPTMGNLSTVMKQMKWVDEDNSLTNFFNVGITEDSQSEKRLEQRFKTGLEDGILTVGIIALIKVISKLPEAAKWFKEFLQDSDPNLVPNVMEKLGLPNPKKDIVAYHGSPHKFERFDHKNISSGEGAQSYGWGTYLAEHPTTAKTYTPRDFDMEDELMKLYDKAMDYRAGTENSIDLQVYESALLHESPDDIMKYMKDAYKGRNDDIARAKSAVAKYRKLYDEANFNFYEVDLPDEYIDDMIDYDAPLSKQSDKVKKIIKEEFTNFDDVSQRYNTIQKRLDELDSQGKLDTNEWKRLVKESQQIRGDLGINPSAEGYEIYNHFVNKFDSPQKASEYLDSKGIKGIKFFDQQSRTAEEGTRNFVVFNEDNMKVLKRNDKVIAKDLVNRTLFHTSSKEFDIMNTNNPAWFAVKESHATEGWGKNITNGGELPHIYKADFKGNLIKRKEARILFKKNNIDFDDYEASLTENPTSKKVLNMKGTQLLKKEGFDGLEYLDYDPRNFQKDLKAIIVFEPSKSISSSKRVKAK